MALQGPMTILDAKEHAAGTMAGAAFTIFEENSALLPRLPLRTIRGNTEKMHIRTRLPNATTRAVNARFTASRGKTHSITETLGIVGGKIEVDRFTEQTEQGMGGGSVLSDQTNGALIAMARQAEYYWFKGDKATNLTEFDGWQARLSDPASNQLIPNGSTPGGDPLDLNQLDLLITRVKPRPSVLACSEEIALLINAYARAAGQAQETVGDNFGRQFTSYAGIPIIPIGEDQEDEPILGFNEANPGGGAAVGGSIYAFYLSADNGVAMLQNSDPVVVPPIDFGEFWVGVAEWYITAGQYSLRSAGRLHGITAAYPS